MPKETQKAKMDAPAFKFFIGLVAGLTAMVLPRLIAALASSTEGSSIRYFSLDFGLLALAFGAIVGLVIMIFEWKIPSRPRDTFMTALGIQVQEPFYYVVLARTDSLPKAREEDSRLRSRVPNAEIIETRQGYFVIQAGGPKPRSRALLEAIRLRKELGLNPMLLEVADGGS